MTIVSKEETARRLAKPECFNEKQWKQWKSAGGWFAKPNPTDYACLDCMPAFKEKMLDEGRCTWPCVEFFAVDDGVEGRRMSINGRESRVFKLKPI